MHNFFFIILSLFLFGCSTPRKLGVNPVAKKIDLKEIEACWQNKCTKEYVIGRYGFGRENLEAQTEVNQVVYFEKGQTLPPFTTFSFDEKNRLVHVVHIPKSISWNKLQELLSCDEWRSHELSPHIARHMNDISTDCMVEPLTVTYNGSNGQVIKLVWGKHPSRLH